MKRFSAKSTVGIIAEGFFYCVSTIILEECQDKKKEQADQLALYILI